MKNLIDLLKFALIAAAILVVGLQLVTAAKTYVRNQAIDGCAAQTFYQNEYKDTEGRLITNREPQKSLYEKCLLGKNIQ